MRKPFIERIKRGSGFKYITSEGKPIKDGRVLAYVEDLVIPPAWKDVQISPNLGAKILVIGIDDAGRKQYIYNPKFRAHQEREKYDKLVDFGRRLPQMRKVTSGHLRQQKLGREKVLAVMVRLIDQAYFRVGNEIYEKENQTYGLTTLRRKHLRIEGDRLLFDYVGKSHKENVREVVDARLAKIVAELDDLPGYRIFQYYGEDGQLRDVNSEDLNEYIQEIMGQDFSAKDFRTWAGTLIAAVALAEIGLANSINEAKRNVTEAVQMVAEKLGNTPAVARSSYIHPRVVKLYQDGKIIGVEIEVEELPEQEMLGQAEVAVLKLLRS